MDYCLRCMENQVGFHHIVTLLKLPASREACLFVLLEDLPISYISQAGYVKRMWQGCRKRGKQLSKPTILPILLTIRYTSRFVSRLVSCLTKKYWHTTAYTNKINRLTHATALTDNASVPRWFNCSQHQLHTGVLAKC